MNIQFSSEYTPEGDYVFTIPGVYHDGSPAIVIETTNGLPQCKVTVCIKGQPSAPDHVWISDIEGNAGVYEGMLTTGTIGPATEYWTAPNGEKAYHCPLIGGALKLWEKG